MYRFSNGLGCHMPYESLDGFREARTHLRARGSCHVSTFPGRGVTFAFNLRHLTISTIVLFILFATPFCCGALRTVKCLIMPCCSHNSINLESIYSVPFKSNSFYLVLCTIRQFKHELINRGENLNICPRT